MSVRMVSPQSCKPVLELEASVAADDQLGELGELR